MREKRQVSGRRGRIDAHDPPRFPAGSPGRYGHRLLPVCCPDRATQDPSVPQSDWPASASRWLSRRVDDLRTLMPMRAYATQTQRGLRAVPSGRGRLGACPPPQKRIGRRVRHGVIPARVVDQRRSGPVKCRQDLVGDHPAGWVKATRLGRHQDDTDGLVRTRQVNQWVGSVGVLHGASHEAMLVAVAIMPSGWGRTFGV
jgi:hypothetical protein